MIIKILDLNDVNLRSLYISEKFLIKIFSNVIGFNLFSDVAEQKYSGLRGDFKLYAGYQKWCGWIRPGVYQPLPTTTTPR
jgi:hypothetical protein